MTRYLILVAIVVTLRGGAEVRFDPSSERHAADHRANSWSMPALSEEGASLRGSELPTLVPAHPPAVAVPRSMPGVSISGIASWYRWRSGQAAAGPALRAFLGPHWRGMTVRVCASHGRCIRVRLTDFMRADRLIDLDRASFAMLASPSRGLLQVTVDRA